MHHSKRFLKRNSIVWILWAIILFAHPRFYTSFRWSVWALCIWLLALAALLQHCQKHHISIAKPGRWSFETLWHLSILLYICFILQTILLMAFYAYNGLDASMKMLGLCGALLLTWAFVILIQE